MVKPWVHCQGRPANQPALGNQHPINDLSTHRITNYSNSRAGKAGIFLRRSSTSLGIDAQYSVGCSTPTWYVCTYVGSGLSIVLLGFGPLGPSSNLSTHRTANAHCRMYCMYDQDLSGRRRTVVISQGDKSPLLNQNISPRKAADRNKPNTAEQIISEA